MDRASGGHVWVPVTRELPPPTSKPVTWTKLTLWLMMVLPAALIFYEMISSSGLLVEGMSFTKYTRNVLDPVFVTHLILAAGATALARGLLEGLNEVKQFSQFPEAFSFYRTVTKTLKWLLIGSLLMLAPIMVSHFFTATTGDLVFSDPETGNKYVLDSEYYDPSSVGEEEPEFSQVSFKNVETGELEIFTSNVALTEDKTNGTILAHYSFVRVDSPSGSGTKMRKA